MRTECKDAFLTAIPGAVIPYRSRQRVICANKQLIYEEAPQSYKSIETVIESLSGAG